LFTERCSSIEALLLAKNLFGASQLLPGQQASIAVYFYWANWLKQKSFCCAKKHPTKQHNNKQQTTNN
jgi:hypothetical protein